MIIRWVSLLLLVCGVLLGATPEEIRRWTAQLRDPDPATRQAAANALGQAGSDAARAIPVLIQAARLFPGPDLADAAHDIEANDPRNVAAVAALQAAISVDPANPALVSFLLAIRSGEQAASIELMTTAIQAFDNHSTKFVRQLVYHLGEEDLDEAITAAQVLAVSEVPSSAYLPKLRKLAERLDPTDEESKHWERLSHSIAVLGMEKRERDPTLGRLIRVRLNVLFHEALTPGRAIEIGDLVQALVVIDPRDEKTKAIVNRMAVKARADRDYRELARQLTNEVQFLTSGVLPQSKADAEARARRTIELATHPPSNGIPIRTSPDSLARSFSVLPHGERIASLDRFELEARRSGDPQRRRLARQTILALWDLGEETTRFFMSESDACNRILRDADVI